MLTTLPPMPPDKLFWTWSWKLFFNRQTNHLATIFQNRIRSAVPWIFLFIYLHACDIHCSRLFNILIFCSWEKWDTKTLNNLPEVSHLGGGKFELYSGLVLELSCLSLLIYSPSLGSWKCIESLTMGWISIFIKGHFVGLCSV